MKVASRVFPVALLFAAACILAAPAPSSARVTLGDDFGAFAEGRTATGGRLLPAAGSALRPWEGGVGWISTSRPGELSYRYRGRDALSYALTAGESYDPRQGTLQFWLQRQEMYPLDHAGRGWETLADFVGEAEGAPVSMLTAYLCWGEEEDGIRSGVNFWGKDEERRVWGFFVPFPHEPAVGEWFHLALSWGPDPERDNAVYFNGERLPGQYKDFYDILPEKAQLEEEHVSPRALLSGARTLRLGLDTVPELYPLGDYPMFTTMVDSFNLSDEVLTAFDLEAPLPMPSSDRHQGPERVKGLTVELVEGAAVLSWPPSEDPALAGYNVYRRQGVGSARWNRLNSALLTDPGYTDRELEPGGTYCYSVSGVDGKGEENSYPYEVKLINAQLYLAALEVEGLGRPFAPGELAGVVLRATPGASCTVRLAGVGPVPATELEPGVYSASLAVPAGADGSLGIVGRVENAGRWVEGTATLATDGTPPASPAGLRASVPLSPRVELAWQGVEDVRGYRVYRGKEAGLLQPLWAEQPAERLSWMDGDALENASYVYGVSAVDPSGNESSPSLVEVYTGADVTPPSITALKESSGGVVLREGVALEVTLSGESGCSAVFLLGEVVEVPMAEAEPAGVYRGSYLPVSADAGAVYPLRAVLTDRSGNASSVEGPPVRIAGDISDRQAPAVASLSHDGRRVAGYSGSLVAGDVLGLRLEGEAGGSAWVTLGGEGRRIDLAESAETPGVYLGQALVGYGDQVEDEPLYGYLADANGNVSAPFASTPLTVDTVVRLALECDRGILPADSSSRARVTVSASDANGDPVRDHPLALNIITTGEYTGLVGSGALGSLKVAWQGDTDLYGEVEAEFTAGFAAKTAILVATDLLTGDVGLGWLRAQVEGTVEVELKAPVLVSLGSGYTLELASDRDAITADGESSARITATVIGPDGSVKGDRVNFSSSEELGTVRAVRPVTDSRGRAVALFTAGRRIGTALVTAVDTTRGVSATLPIVLMSDAPAKVFLTAADGWLWADGESRTELSVKVSDINDNPNQNTEVRFWVDGFNGAVDPEELLTDYNGEGASSYRSGTRPGVAVIRAQVTSSIPTAGELERAGNSLCLPWDEKGDDEVEVVTWLAEPGDELAEGQGLLVYREGREERTFVSPRAGTLEELPLEFVRTIPRGAIVAFITPAEEDETP